MDLDRDNFVYIPAAKTNIAERIKQEWQRLGQLPPEQDPRVQQHRQKARSYGRQDEA
jgi:hypothetical protein